MRSETQEWEIYPCWHGKPPLTRGPTVVDGKGNIDVATIPRNEESNAGITKGNHVDALPYWSDRLLVTVEPRVRNISYGVAVTRMPIPPPENTCIPDGDPGGSKTIVRNKYSIDPFEWAPAPEFDLPEVSPAELEFLRGMADTRALASLNKAMVNLPMLFKERRETLKMAAGKVGVLADAARSIQQRDFSRYRKVAKKDRRRVARDIANEHLEIIFGWLPLISEVEGAMDYIAQERFEFIKGRGSHVITRDEKVKVSKPVIGLDGWYGYNREVARAELNGARRELIGMRTNLRMDITSAIAGDARQLGFEPISTLYDMVPLSFVSGWISNFDAYVRTIAPLVGLSFRTGSRNLRRQVVLDVAGRVLEQNPPTYPSPWRAWVEERDHSVSLLTGSRTRDDRSLVVELPKASLHWDVDVGFNEVTAAISLLIQRKLKPLQRAIGIKQFRYRGPKPKWLPDIRYRKP